MTNKITHAGDIKPDFKEIKKVWRQMLSRYFDNNGVLKRKYIVHVNCPYCNSKKYHNKFNINGFIHVTCFNCNTVFVTPRLKDEYIDLLYSDTYYSELYINSMIPAFNKRKTLIGQSKFKQVLEYSINKGSVLDIGCGVGEVIDVFNDNDWDCHAIEFNPGAVDWLNKIGINVSNIHFNEYNSGMQFDVIMAWNVIEHVIDPLLFLKKVNSLLKPGGIFVSEVPHGNSLIVDYSRLTNKDPERIIMGEQHIVLYSMEAYIGLHESIGLNNLHIQTNGLDVSTIFDVNEVNINEDILNNTQELIDKKLYGDLLRGFWIKKHK